VHCILPEYSCERPIDNKRTSPAFLPLQFIVCQGADTPAAASSLPQASLQVAVSVAACAQETAAVGFRVYGFRLGFVVHETLARCRSLGIPSMAEHLCELWR